MANLPVNSTVSDALSVAGSTKPDVWLKFFDYTTSFTLTSSSLVQTNPIQLDSASYFELQGIVASLYNAATGLPLVTGDNLLSLQGTIQLVDGSSNYPLFSQPQDINLVCGTASRPMILPVPYIFLPATSLSVQIAAQAASVGTDTLNLNLTFRGYKKYPMNGSVLRSGNSVS